MDVTAVSVQDKRHLFSAGLAQFFLELLSSFSGWACISDTCLAATSYLQLQKLSFGWKGGWGRRLIWSLVSINRYSSLKSFCVPFYMDLCFCMHPYSWVHGCTFKIRYLKLRGFSCSVYSPMSSYSRNMLYSVGKKWDFEWKVWKSGLKPWGEDWNLKGVGTSFLIQAIQSIRCSVSILPHCPSASNALCL